MESVLGSKFKAAQALLLSKYKLDCSAIVNFRKDLHKHPETGYREVRTKEKLISWLIKRGAKTQDIKHFAKTGFTYDIVGTHAMRGPKMTIGFRADMDALQMKELNTFPHASIYPNAAHMCGHDGHMATLIGTADVLMQSKNKIPSNKTIRLIFQPAEEGGNGGEKMVLEGALAGVDEVYAYHSWSLPYGKFGISKDGIMTTRVVHFQIDVQGKGSHGAYPEKGHDPIAALCQTYSSIHTILSRGIGRKEFAVCTIGTIKAGTADNIIPDMATMGGTIRTHKLEIEEEIKKQLENIAAFVPKSLGCEGKVTYFSSYPAIMNAKKQAAELRKAVAELFGEESLTEEGMNASEDFSYMTEKVPGAYMLLGHVQPHRNIMNHNPYFDFNDDLIPPSILAWLKLIENRFEISLE